MNNFFTKNFKYILSLIILITIILGCVVPVRSRVRRPIRRRIDYEVVEDINTQDAQNIVIIKDDEYILE